MFRVIECVGTDGLLHFCEPHKATTVCGKEIKTKKPGKVDLKRFNCPDCGY